MVLCKNKAQTETFNLAGVTIAPRSASQRVCMSYLTCTDIAYGSCIQLGYLQRIGCLSHLMPDDFLLVSTSLLTLVVDRCSLRLTSPSY
jgi:hypothetical protein